MIRIPKLPDHPEKGQWRQLGYTQVWAHQIVQAEKEALTALLAACGKSSDPVVREALAAYRVLLELRKEVRGNAAHGGKDRPVEGT